MEKHAKRRAWNKDKAVGQKDALTFEETRSVLKFLNNDTRSFYRLRNLSLMMLGVDMNARIIDLLSLRVETVYNCFGKAHESFRIFQQKKNRPGSRSEEKAVDVWLSPVTINYLEQWYNFAKKKSGQPIFTGQSTPNKAITEQTFRRQFKGWLLNIGIDPSRYSGHTLRRTHGQFIIDQGGDLIVVRDMLGQKSIRTTESYFNVKLQRIIEAKKKYPILPSTLLPPEKKEVNNEKNGSNNFR